MFLGLWSKSIRNGLLLPVAWLLSIMPALANVSVGATQCVETNSTISGAQLLPHMVHYLDSSGVIKTPDLNTGYEISRMAQGLPFVALKTSSKTAILKKNNSNHWFRFCLRNLTNQPQSLVVAFEPPTLTEIDFYPQKPDLPSFKTGSSKKMSTRDIPNPQFDFNVRLVAGEQQVFYVRVNTATTPFLLAKLWDRSSYDIDNNINESKFGIFVGVLMGLVLYNLLLFVSAGQFTSLLYVAWSLSIFMLLSSIDGRLVQYLTPNFPQFGRLVTTIFYPLSVLLSAFFCKELTTLKNYPKLNRAGNALLVGSLLLLFISYFYDPAAYTKVCALFAVIVAVYFGLIVPIYGLFKDRLIVAKYVLISQVPIMLVIFDRTLFSLGITAQYYIPFKAMTALIVALVLISYFIGLMVYREKAAAQRAALEQLNISNTLKESYNTQLEEELKLKTVDIRSMNSDLEKQAIQLVQLDESRSKFFANISHEFRTPLTLIEGPLSMLLERDGFPEKQTIEGVVRNSQSLKRLIDQILLLSELDEKSLDLKASKIDVVQAVTEFSAQFASGFDQKGIRLSVKSEWPVIHAYVDYEKLQIIINNLLRNAIKFTQESGQVSIEISSTTAQDEQTNEYSRDEYVKIVVSDTGLGIPQNELIYVFDRYFQSGSSELSKSGLGTGIGLALVKELVDLHAGDIAVQSVYEQDNNKSSAGTSFSVTLPLGRAHLNDHEIVQSVELGFNRREPTESRGAIESSAALASKTVPQDASLESEGKPQIKQTTVLVVDDNEDMLRYIRNLLEGDYNVITAQDGLLAEEVMNKHVPDIIVTDLMMPNRNGLEFVESIKKDNQFLKIPVIMLTARAGLDDRIKGLMAAVDDYLVKPFNARELKARIKNLLNKQIQFDAFYQNQASKSENTPSSEPETYIGKVKSVVNQRLIEPGFGVVELAQALHVSEATLRRRLSENANFTPAAFIRHCRLEKARQISQQGNVRSIVELANAVGFRQPSYFSRLYQKTFNCQVDIKN